jgi:hypothetical protein
VQQKCFTPSFSEIKTESSQIRGKNQLVEMIINATRFLKQKLVSVIGVSRKASFPLINLIIKKSNQTFNTIGRGCLTKKCSNKKSRCVTKLPKIDIQ